MNLRELVSSTRQVKTNMWNPNKDFRSREFGSIIDFNVKGIYNSRFKTLTVTMYIKSKTQRQRDISKGLGDSVISTHTAAIVFKNIVEHVVYVKEYTDRYNAITPESPITSVQDIINKMQQSEPNLVPVDITDDIITFRTKIDFNTECRVKCTCAHFYYTFAYYCAQAGAYIGDAVAPYKSYRKMKNKFKFRNSNGVPGLCKHLQLLITYILKTDNGINGNIEYANSRILIPNDIKKQIQPSKKVNNADNALKNYKEDKGLISENRNNYIKLAHRELRQFNNAVRQQKSENYDSFDKSEIDNNGRY